MVGTLALSVIRQARQLLATQRAAMMAIEKLGPAFDEAYHFGLEGDLQVPDPKTEEITGSDVLAVFGMDIDDEEDA